jgi:heme-degrading monooxygenase HmoA
VFARVICAQTAPDGIDGALRIAEEQLPGARGQRGFKGFYLLADRSTGKLMTISLWDSADDVSAAETRAAQIRSKAMQAIGAAAPAIDTYQVEIAVLA